MQILSQFLPVQQLRHFRQAGVHRIIQVKPAEYIQRRSAELIRSKSMIELMNFSSIGL